MDYDDGKKSLFNAGVALTERIDSLQRAINSAKFNPLTRNLETGTFNYEVLLVSADCLMAEGWDKFSEKEREHITKMNNMLKELNKLYPPIYINSDGNPAIHHENYERLLKFFQMYELKLKDLYGKHNLNSPTRDDDDGL